VTLWGGPPELEVALVPSFYEEEIGVQLLAAGHLPPSFFQPLLYPHLPGGSTRGPLQTKLNQSLWFCRATWRPTVR
jgi:hypothetical protein